MSNDSIAKLFLEKKNCMAELYKNAIFHSLISFRLVLKKNNLLTKNGKTICQKKLKTYHLKRVSPHNN